MTPAPEPSCVLKLKRAVVHLNELDLACRGWLAEHNKISCRLEPCIDAPGYFLVKATADEIPNEPFSLIAGDAIQNLRGALDHLVYALAIKHSQFLSEKEAHDTQFPIIGDESESGKQGVGADKWRDNAIPRMVKKLSPQAQAIIEGLQPFKLGKTFRDHFLWRFNELVNCDKHRFIHVSVAQSSGIYLDPSGSKNVQIMPGMMEIYSPVMDGETVIAKMPLGPIDPRLEMHMEVLPALYVAFKDGISKEKDVVKELAEIHNYVVTQIFLKLAPLL